MFDWLISLALSFAYIMPWENGDISVCSTKSITVPESRQIHKEVWDRFNLTPSRHVFFFWAWVFFSAKDLK